MMELNMGAEVVAAKDIALGRLAAPALGNRSASDDGGD
jgi:hypothetical protein